MPERDRYCYCPDSSVGEAIYDRRYDFLYPLSRSCRERREFDDFFGNTIVYLTDVDTLYVEEE